MCDFQVLDELYLDVGKTLLIYEQWLEPSLVNESWNMGAHQIDSNDGDKSCVWIQ